MFQWWTNLRRQRKLARPVNSTWPNIVQQYAWQWAYMPASVAERAMQWLRIFESEKYWEGCGGFKLTESHRVAIAAQASLMTIALPERFFGCQSLLIYPENYVAPGVSYMVNGQVGVHGEQIRSGETSYRGPVILNWSAVTAAGRHHNYLWSQHYHSRTGSSIRFRQWTDQRWHPSTTRTNRRHTLGQGLSITA